MMNIKDIINKHLDKQHPEIIKHVLIEFYLIDQNISDRIFHLVDIIKNKDFCVEQEDLVEYKIIKKNNYNKILSLFKKYDFIENIDYIIRKKVPSNAKLGNKFILTPKSFFICLTRSKNSYRYSSYYFHIQEIYDYI